MVEVQIVSEAEAEQADFVVCILADWESPFADNLKGTCNDCGRTIQFRPHVPKAPRKICIECMYDRERGGEA